MRPMIGLAILGLAVAGCAPIGPQQPIAQPAPGVVVGGGGGGGIAMFPECEAAEIAFAGETTLAALGLADTVGRGPDATRPGWILVTAESAAIDVPEPAGGKGAVVLPAGRWVCVTWPDGSGMATNVPDAWQLPSTITEAAASNEAAPLEAGPIAVLVAVVVLVGASVVAFRRGDREPTTGVNPG